MSRIGMLVGSFAIGLVIAASKGYAIDIYPASACVHPSGTQGDGTIINQTSAMFWPKCPIKISDTGGADDDDIRAYYYDRPWATSPGLEVYCAVNTSDLNGSQYWYTSAIKYGCPNAGGCTFSVLGFSGAGYLSFDNIVRVGQDRVTVECGLPGSAYLYSLTYSPS